jgi:CYTH domain-containing protein
MIEIERKFLVRNHTFKEMATRHFRIKQGFLNSHPERTVRVRLSEERGNLTIKGAGNENGTTRFELEYSIPADQAARLLAICEPGIIDKTRYEIPLDGHVWEVDVFEGENKGLIIAELELESEEEQFSVPGWLGEEVTGQIQYYNSQLSKKPYSKWI